MVPLIFGNSHMKSSGRTIASCRFVSPFTAIPELKPNAKTCTALGICGYYRGLNN